MRPEGVPRGPWIEYNLLFLAEHFLGRGRSESWLYDRRVRLWNRLREHFAESNRGGLFDIEGLPADAPPESLRRPGRDALLPKVFRGAAAEWPCVRRWSVDFFEQRHAGREVILNDNPGLIDPRSPQEFAQRNLGDYIRLLKAGSLEYLKFSRLADEDSGLSDDLDLDWLRRYRLPLSFREETYLFIGGAGTMTPIHVGFSCNLFVQVWGRKKWILFAPEERIVLDPRAERTFYFHSRADPHDSADPAFPLLPYAFRYEVALEPGDVLWVPPFVWHQVENPTQSIGIAYRFNSIPAAFRSSTILAGLTFLATNPNPLHHFLVTTFTKQALIFVRKNRVAD